MGTGPQDLVRFGDRYRFPGNERYPEQVATLNRLAGPTMIMRFGMAALADPWFPEAAPQQAATALGKGEKQAALTTITLVASVGGAAVPVVVAASIGPVGQVASWGPLVQNEQHFQLDVDSGLGAFYEITDAAALQPLFEDDLHMKGVHDRALSELVVPMEVDGRTVATAFLTPGSGLYPAWLGFDKDMRAVAVVIDLGFLDGVERVGRAPTSV